ncbi:YHS domain-containing protein [Dethiothermospora halolimnae]
MKEIETVKDPVCDMYISKRDAISKTIDGRTYFFCSEERIKKFKNRRKSH